MKSLEDLHRIKREAYRLGFDLCGVTRSFEPLHASYLKKWYSEKRYAGMEWMTRHENFRFKPQSLLEGTQTALVLAVSYAHEPKEKEYLVARYAYGRDYHLWMREKINKLIQFILTEIKPGFAHKSFVDTGPVLERDLAAQAGLGWIGKNTCVINKELGSYLFLGVVFSDLDFPQDAPQRDACLDCRLCIDACPTAALQPYQLDPKKCLAFHNIEQRGERNSDYWHKMENHLVGCDVCQEVCPWNFSAPLTRQNEWLDTYTEFSCENFAEILHMSEDVYRKKMRNSAISRIKYFDFMRNVFIVIANQKYYELLPLVQRWKQHNPESDLAEWDHCVAVLLKGKL